MLAVGAIQLLLLLLGLARAKFLSFAIGTEGYGIVGTIDQIIVTLVGVGSLGIPFVAIKILSRNQSETREGFEHAYAGFVAGLFTLGILTTAVGVLLALFAPLTFGSRLAPYSTLLAVAIVAVPSLMLNNLIPNALAASRFGRRAALYTLVVQAVLLVSTIVGAVTGGVRGIYIATVVGGTLLTFGALLAFNSTLGSPFRGGFSWIVAQVRRERTLLVYAFWSYTSTAIYALSLSGLRTSVFSNDGASAAGLFGAALNLALTVGAVVSPISNLLLTPFLNRTLPASQKIRAANDFALKMLTVVLVVSLPLVLFPELAMRILFAPAFRPGAAMLFALVAWQCLAQAVNIYTQLLIGLDDFAFGCVATIAGNGAIFLFAPSVTAQMGILGPALLLLTGAVVCGLLSAFRLGRKFHATLEAGVFFRLAFALFAIAGSRLLAQMMPELTLSGFAVRVSYAAAALVVLTLLLSADEKEWVGSLIRGRLKSAS